VSTWNFRRVQVPGDGAGPATPGGSGTGTQGGLDLELQPELEPATVTGPAGTGTGEDASPTLAGRVIAAGTERAARVARTGTRRAGGAIGRLGRTPGTVVHAVWNCRPLTIGEHAEHARRHGWVPEGRDPEGLLGRAGEVHQRTIGRALKYGSTAVSRMADNPVAQWIAMLVIVLIAIAILCLVL
jgi:hypothetical protein